MSQDDLDFEEASYLLDLVEKRHSRLSVGGHQVIIESEYHAIACLYLYLQQCHCMLNSACRSLPSIAMGRYSKDLLSSRNIRSPARNCQVATAYAVHLGAHEALLLCMACLEQQLQRQCHHPCRLITNRHQLM